MTVSMAQGLPSQGSDAKPPEIDGVRAAESKFQPLATLPRDVPGSYRRRWERLATQATTSYRAAVELKCLECCCRERTEVKRCDITGCPLWALSCRIFGRSTGVAMASGAEGGFVGPVRPRQRRASRQIDWVVHLEQKGRLR